MTRDRNAGAGARLAGGLLLGVAAALVAAALAAAAEEKFSAFNGKVTYRTYCQSCHGAAGKGDGPIATALKDVPTDLTLLAKKSEGGEYPAEQVKKSIDGREEIAAHGSREMPVWGDAFLWPPDNPNKEADAKRKIGELVEFLRTIQAPAGK